MLLDIRKLFSQPESAQPLTFSLDLSEADLPGYQVQACEGSLAVSWEGHGSRLRLKLTAQATLCAACARCLRPVQTVLPLSRTILLYRRSLAENDEDLPLTPEGKLDVTELVYTEILVSAPIVFLCAPDCKGLEES